MVAKKQLNSKAKEMPVVADPRFTKLHFDPRFIRPKKDASKLKIDSRFAGMLNSDEFGSTNVGLPKVDKYGRPNKASVKKDLQRFYKLEEDDHMPQSDQNEFEKESGSDEELTKEEGSSASDDEEEIAGYKLARGEGLLESSSDEEDSENEQLDSDIDDVGDVLENESNVPLGEETRRLAVVNLDWDYIRAKDLYKLFDGFKPANGLIRSVKIYPSEFGKERMAKEEESGPMIFQKESTQEKGPLVKEDAGEEFDSVALRKYQLERLKYYYAIVECNSVKTAKAIYEACDGAEFEASANFLDLRFVPDETMFDEEPKEEAIEASASYKPTEFTTRALQHSKVKLTWDEDDHERTRVTHRKFSKEDLKDMDFKAYLASDSEDEDEEKDPESLRSKYKALLLGGDGEMSDAPQEDMEITFILGLSEKAAGLLEKKKEEESRKNESVFEAQLRKRREKKKARKKERESGVAEGETVEDPLVDGDGAFDDNDPFFQLDDESDYEPAIPRAPPTTPSKKMNAKKTKEDIEQEKRSKAELELLLMDEKETTERHYNMKSILQAEKDAKRNNKRKKKKGQELDDTQDDFQSDVQDSRFADLLDSHHFAIDPTNPQFKKTKNMEKLLQLRREQRAKTVDSVDRVEKEVSIPQKMNEKKKSSELSNLVASIKRKTDHRGPSQGPKRPRF